jgi:hypothetical protein
MFVEDAASSAPGFALHKSHARLYSCDTAYRHNSKCMHKSCHRTEYALQLKEMRRNDSSAHLSEPM